ncbi:MAG: tetratricopeptide repeat protein, partial [candidate division WOR-3 bacterium]
DSSRACQLTEQGVQAFYREDEETALDLFLEVIQLSPDNLRVHYLAALCACILSEEETLEEVCNHALATGQHHPYTVACEAVRYLFLANFARAEDLFHRAIMALPDEPNLHIGLGLLYEESGDLVKGTDAYRRVLEINPDNVRARVALGVIYAMNGEYASALDEYRRAKELDPAVENPHQHLGRDYYHDGLLSEAAAEFAQAIEEEPDQPGAWFYLLDCAIRLNRIDEALDIYASIRERFGDKPELTAGFYEYFHMRKEAIAALEELARRQPGDAEVWFRLSRLCAEAGRYEEARQAAERAARLAPESGNLFTWLAQLAFRAEDYQQAIEMSQTAIRLNRYDQEAYQVMSDALLYLGRAEESQAVSEKLEEVRNEAWQQYQAKFSGQDQSAAS